MQALDFYISHLASKDATALLAPAITTAIDARLKRFEKNIAENLFRVAVEQDMVNSLLATVHNLNEEYLLDLRSDAIYNVKKTNGQLSLEQHAEKKYEDLKKNQPPLICRVKTSLNNYHYHKGSMMDSSLIQMVSWPLLIAIYVD